MSALPNADEKLILLPSDRIERVSGYGMVVGEDGYCFRPASEEQVRDVILLARKTGRKIVQRGAGRSYGDANVGAECIILDCTRRRRILNWDPASGVIEAEGGLTIEGLWRHCMEDGYWPPVVSGTMFPTLGGALGMNIHGKNNYCKGTLGEHVLELRVMDGLGNVRTLTPQDEAFYAVISGAGLLGVILTVKLKMKKIESGNLRVLGLSIPNLSSQIEHFEKYEHESDYMVSWIDCFAKGRKLGRGEMHVGWYADFGGQASLRPDNQDLPDTILGLVPKSMVWRALKFFSRRTGMHFINSAKCFASDLLGDGKTKAQSLVGFSFLLDYVPNWRWAYKPGGFIQYQTFVPKANAERVFQRQIELQQEMKMESYLGVMKRHRPDKFLFSHAVDGYSFAQDFKVTSQNWDRMKDLAHRMNDITLDAGGRFYFAKDLTLRPSDVKRYLGEAALEKFHRLKGELDPDGLFTSELAKRVELVK